MSLPPLHAEDPMGEAAHEAAGFASRLDLRLLGAASPTMARADRADALLAALTQWPKLRRAMEKLAEAAPIAAREAEEADARTLAVTEREAIGPSRRNHAEDAPGMNPIRDPGALPSVAPASGLGMGEAEFSAFEGEG